MEKISFLMPTHQTAWWACCYWTAHTILDGAWPAETRTIRRRYNNIYSSVCTIRIKNKKTKKKETSGPIKVPSPPFAYFQTQKHLLNNMEKELVAIIFSSSRMQLGIKETGQMKMSTFGRRSGVFLCLFYFILEIYRDGFYYSCYIFFLHIPR